MYRVEIRKSAIKELSRLPAKEALWVAEQINQLKDDPRPPGAIKLKGGKDQYRIRVGNYRALYAIQDTLLLVEIFKIGHRKDIY